ncbi:signal peptidase II [Cellulosimicrobium arenosum]|uniref:Lipoprotein signal peptidase n=1 Tax=Cellulosimicrobium arenosum TaxID=2708133 RepID=A0A927G949_9MICO|nr:signal peptidase II [Cellulosimicrobium arenosum]MBD8079184.1 signal peptidase II [Cellulosimicrobium arenosum]
MSHTEPPAAPEPSEPAATTARRRLVGLTASIALLVLAADQLTKWWAESDLEQGEAPVPVLGDLISLRLVYNDGAALSIASGMTWLLTIVVVAVVVVIVRMMGRIRSRGWALALGLLLGGAVGNLVDRLFREPGFARGEVVDFIAYADFFVGNVADIAIVAAAVMIAILSVLGVGLDGSRPGHGTPSEPAEGSDDDVDVATGPVEGPLGAGEPSELSDPATGDAAGEAQGHR